MNAVGMAYQKGENLLKYACQLEGPRPIQSVSSMRHIGLCPSPEAIKFRRIGKR